MSSVISKSNAAVPMPIPAPARPNTSDAVSDRAPSTADVAGRDESSRGAQQRSSTWSHAEAADRQGWFDTYVTPVVGRVFLDGETANTWAWAAGVQVYFWPNDVDEPMWINGGIDLRRAFALELAVVTDTDGFGPGDRFGGFAGDGSPPLLVGGALHIIPYATLSLGVAIVEERSTRVANQRGDLKGCFYLGLSVQANVPGLIRNLTTSKD